MPAQSLGMERHRILLTLFEHMSPTLPEARVPSLFGYINNFPFQLQLV